ncbi:MAG: hypothetical protein ACMUEL_08720 [Flavobacteriales bacterium Tduv]
MTYVHSKTGIDVYPEAHIGKAFTIDHSTGIVIASRSRISHHVMIYQGVTLYAIHVEKSLADKKRHPTIEYRITIYAGGHHYTCRKNNHRSLQRHLGIDIWLTHSVPAFFQGDIKKVKSRCEKTALP